MVQHRISPQDAHNFLIAGDAVLIDVREPDEFGAEHIACAASVPLGHIPTLFNQMKIPAGRKIIFQCMMGGRGDQACAVLPDSGQYDVYNIDGGINAWKAAGLPVVQNSAVGVSPVSIFRQVQIIVGALVALCVALGLFGITIGFVLAGFFGAALFMAGVTGWCGLAILLRRMPWNR